MEYFNCKLINNYRLKSYDPVLACGCIEFLQKQSAVIAYAKNCNIKRLRNKLELTVN